MSDGGDEWTDGRDQSDQSGDSSRFDDDAGEENEREQGSTDPASEQPDMAWTDSGRKQPARDEEAVGSTDSTRPGQESRTREPTDPGEPLPPEILLEYTTDRRSLSSVVQLQWGVWKTISVIILTVISTVILANVGVDPRVGAILLIFFFFLGMYWVHLRYKRWVYQIREDAIYLERGVLTHIRTLVPYVRIQHVDTSRGPLERALGLSTLVVYTAGSRGADVSIPGLTPEEASDLQQRVKELAIEAEGDDAL